MKEIIEELKRAGASDEEIKAVLKECNIRPRWQYWPWDPRSGWVGGNICGIVLFLIVLYCLL